jgi:hypothetical protein
MTLALLFLAGLSALVPARWNSADPAALDVLRDGPVNCILVEARNWSPALVEGARKRRIAVLGVVHPVDGAGRQAARAVALKLAGVALEGAANAK